MRIDCLAHVHSSFSYDSKTDLADIARIARENGIQCVLMSEHNNFLDPGRMSRFVSRCQGLSDERLLIIPGLELALDANRIHLLAFGIRQFVESSGDQSTFPGLIDTVQGLGGVAVLAHPSHRGAASRIQRQHLCALDGIEVWNVKNGSKYFPAVEDLNLLRSVRASAPKPVFGFAGLDWHHAEKFSRIVLRLDVANLTPELVLHSLRAGTFTIHSGSRSLPATGDIGRSRAIAYMAGARGLKEARRMGYRWQSRLERSGYKPPRFIMSAARRFLG